METFPLSSAFVVIGLHITENLQHHKKTDVKRILEEKGFSQTGQSPDPVFQFYTQDGNVASAKRTIILFDDKDTVHTDGVQFYEDNRS